MALPSARGWSEAERRELRYMLEDLWRRRVPGTREFEPMGTMNADRIIMKKILGIDGQGTSGTVGVHLRPQLPAVPGNQQPDPAGGAAGS